MRGFSISSDQLCVNLCTGIGFLYLETSGLDRGLGLASYSIWPKIQISCDWVALFLAMLCWVVGAAKFSDSNAWTASTKVTPKGLRWLPCTYWRLGWCRMPQSPVLIQWCENCLVVVGLCLMLCHTQCIRNLDWNKQWFSRAPVVCLCPLPIGLDLGRLCAESLTNWRVFLEREVQLHHSLRDFVDSSTDRNASLILILECIWVVDRGAVKCVNLHLWATNLKPILVAHSCMAFTACCRCHPLVSRGRRPKKIVRWSIKKVFWICPWQYERAAY